MTEYKKCADILVFNDAGELALQLRAPHDDSFPSHWDFGAGGGIDAGEDAKESAEREIQEELGVSATMELVAQKHYIYPSRKPDTTREVDASIFKAKHNGPFTIDPNELQEVKFFKLEDIQHLIETKGATFHPEFLCAWNDGTIKQTADSMR